MEPTTSLLSDENLSSVDYDPNDPAKYWITQHLNRLDTGARRFRAIQETKALLRHLGGKPEDRMGEAVSDILYLIHTNNEERELYGERVAREERVSYGHRI